MNFSSITITLWITLAALAGALYTPHSLAQPLDNTSTDTTPTPTDTTPTPTDTPAANASDTPPPTADLPPTDTDTPPDPNASLFSTNQRLREISNQVEELKEETFAAKSRLLLLRASVLRRTIAGSKVIVIHHDEMGGEYTPVQASYSLDRERKLNRMNTTDIKNLHEQIIIDEKLIPGSHILTVRMVYKGAPWGVFQYMDGYTFTIESSYAFTAEEGKIHEITSTAFEKGTVFTRYEDRPTIGYQTKTHNLDSASQPVAAAQ
jgi:hypothetical protein